MSLANRVNMSTSKQSSVNFSAKIYNFNIQSALLVLSSLKSLHEIEMERNEKKIKIAFSVCAIF